MPFSADLVPLIPEIAAAAGAEPLSADPIRRGANNRVYRLETDRGVVCLKFHPRVTGDDRDRWGAETGALDFLARHGVDTVPRLLARNRRYGFAILEWIEGAPVVGDGDVDQALAFARRLRDLRTAPGAEALPPASEACLSLDELISQVRRRLARLLAAGAVPDGFLEGPFAETLDRAETRARRLSPAPGELPIERRTLSPSDFGFHNALRRADGRLVFLDFEYFGWDDPAKLVADFILHPGMNLSAPAASRFRAGAADLYADDPTFAARLSATSSLYGLRWCMIILNEFLPERWERRRRAGETADRAEALIRQLAKARTTLVRVHDLLEDTEP